MHFNTALFVREIYTCTAAVCFVSPSCGLYVLFFFDKRFVRHTPCMERFVDSKSRVVRLVRLTSLAMVLRKI